ncbi:MAG TPA: hypothetical protein VJR92_08090 [Gemmatimonadaceae bacterium]|nr:hypothetical protein [Gemmatimonadaceae bacterium]
MSVRTRIRNGTPMRNGASSSLRHILALGALLVASAAPARAQDSLRTKLDSLAARVERAEERVKMLEQALATESQSSVKTRSRVAMEFRGLVLVNGFMSSRRVNSTGNPVFVRPDDPADPFPRGMAMHVRQSMLGFTIGATDVLGARFTGDVDVDFHGGQLPSSGGRTFPLIRMRTARAILQWPRAEVLLGQESPLITPVNPVSLASISTPGFAAAGNLWLWIPQARFTVETGGRLRFGVQGAVLAPGTGAAVGTFDVPNFDPAERSDRPFLQGRTRLRWGADDMTAEVGLGGHVGWFALANDSLAPGKIIAADASVPITRWLEVRGELYQGRGARALGGGGVGQLFGNNSVVIRSRGGWGQLNVRPNTSVIVGAGYGSDDPHNTDLPASSRFKNTVASGHVAWRPAGPLVFGAEYRRITTYYLPGRFASDHVNIAFGFEF